MYRLSDVCPCFGASCCSCACWAWSGSHRLPSLQPLPGQLLGFRMPVSHRSSHSERVPGAQLPAAAVAAGPGVQRAAGVAGGRRGARQRAGAVRQGRLAARAAPLRRLHAAGAGARARDAGRRAGGRGRGPPAPDLALAPRGPRLRGVQGRVGARAAAHRLPVQLPVKPPGTLMGRAPITLISNPRRAAGQGNTCSWLRVLSEGEAVIRGYVVGGP